MTAATPTVIERYIGDDWTVGPITLTAGSVPLDATGAKISAELYVAYQAAPILVLIEGSGVTMVADRTTGIVSEIWVPRAITATVPAQARTAATTFGGRCLPTYPTRIDIVVTDSLGRRRTWLIVPVLALDPRVDLPGGAS